MDEIATLPSVARNDRIGMSLQTYQKKRKFNTTPEPKGTVKSNTGVLSFVIQKHAASRLHYDFRLELNGVLKSWAIPKGPSLNPDDKRLAVLVEDHPIDYANFEGIIPKGNYGGGTVMVWDKGVYSPMKFENRKQAENLLNEQFKKGHLTFVLLGEKLRGEFALVKTHGGDLPAGRQETWLLIKAGDEYASKKDVLQQDHSVISNRSMDEIARESEEKNDVWYSDKPPTHVVMNNPKSSLNLDEAPKGSMPHDVKPMLAKSIDEPFDSEEWIFELKYDGYRAIAEIESGKVKLYSRNKLSFNEKFAPIAQSLQKFAGDAILDGEVVVVDENGIPHFQWLQDYPKSKKGNLVYYVFDILYYDGHIFSSLPLLERKKILKQVLPPLPNIIFADHIKGAGIAMFRQTAKMGLEGVIAKKSTSIYKQGDRTGNWIKIKSQKRQEVVIAGFTKPKGGRKHFGALLAGVYKKGKLTYVGHVGGGFDEKGLAKMYDLLKPLVQEACPFAEKPETNTPATWIRPQLLAEVSFSEWTQDGQMRHPVFIGLREDKEPKEVGIESALHEADSMWSSLNHPPSATPHKPHLTNLSKIFFPDDNITKGDLIEYYREIAPLILPHLKDRPQSMLRYPNGITGERFYQKDASLLNADWIPTETIYSESNQKNIDYLLCQDEATLVYLINLGCIDLNPWISRIGHLEKPDYLIIDLDPEATDFVNVVKTALACREILEQFDIPSFCKTSGAKGMHIYVPLGAKYTYEQSRKLAELLCIYVHNKVPDITSMKRNPKERQGLVYLDYLQNTEGQTLASVYSVRAQPGAPVSTPLLWSEVTGKIHPTQFTIKNIGSRIQKHGDLFKEVLGKGIDMEKILLKISKLG